MPVSYQGWEMASGPTVAYNMAGRTNGCVVVESPKGSNFSGFRIQDSMPRGFGEMPKSSSYRFSSPQENVVWGLSTLSLRGQAQADSDLSGEENRNVPLCVFGCATTESYRCTPCPKSSDCSLLAYVQPSGCWRSLNLDIPACDGSFVSSSETGFQASSLHIDESATSNHLRSHVEASSQQRAATIDCETALLGSCCGDEASEHGDAGSFFKTLRSSSSSLHLTRKGISEDEELDPDTISNSSFSSENGMLLASPSSSREASLDDTEAESSYKEPAGLSFTVRESSPPRKGLSKFYAGKARSFSCLMDVGSVKDLAKPEVPHAKKRRANSGSSGLPPLQKGASAISKKPLHSGKSTLALAVAMTRKEEYEVQASVGNQKQQKSLVPSRSYSLPDLQGATRSIFFIG